MFQQQRLALNLAASALLVVMARADAAGADKSTSESESEAVLEADIVATSIRDKGYSCEAVQSMERIERDDPDIRSAWRVHCKGGGSYQVVYIGDRGYRVEPEE